jgi:hypothetical protein
MSVTGLGPAQGAAAIANAGQAPGAAPDAAQVEQFDALMQPAVGQSVAPTGMLSARMTSAQAHVLPLGDQLRAYGNGLDARYAEIETHRAQMLTSMTDSRRDPLMSMVQAMDFQWTATATISEYQLSLAVAQAANGCTHTLLKNQE